MRIKNTYKDQTTGKMMRRCGGTCGQTLNLNKKNFHKGSRNGFQSKCKTCNKKVSAAQQARDGNASTRMGKAYHWASMVVANGNSRVQPGAVCDLTAKQVLKLYEKTTKCMCGCGEPLPLLELGVRAEFAADHIFEIREGGPHTISNIQLLLHKCHLIKSNNKRKERKVKRTIAGL